MPISFYQHANLFHLYSNDMSYIIRIFNGYPLHLYWGNRITDSPEIMHLFDNYRDETLRSLLQEYPQYGTSDFRHPAYQVQLPDGSRITELVYHHHEIINGKPGLSGLPSIYVEDSEEATTLILHLKDYYSGLTVALSYSIYSDLNVLSRSATFTNNGKKHLHLLRALSASVDFADNDYDLIYLYGASRRERQIERRTLGHGISTIESRRGASGHHFNPFLALVKPETTEDFGDTYGFSFIYSGNFKMEAEVDQFHSTRVSVGINPFDFSWNLTPKETFQTPEVVMVYSNNGLGDMSRTFHQLFRERLCRGTYKTASRPILINNWEATYFDFDEDKILAIADSAVELGIELLVLDDGWFGKRNDDTSSLGDWFVNKQKLPNGLQSLAEKINAKNLKFGLWVEPEMISPDSDLYRKHPDWCIHVDGRKRTEYRNQLVLDLSRQDVRDYLYETLYNLFSSLPISYVKWDMNRNMTEIGSKKLKGHQQKELAHRYILGLYELLEKLTKAFPKILFEGCAGGGGRFDPGILYYMPQIWTSDNTDAVERQKIQYGTSLVYPFSTMGSHVSDIPNHQVGRITSLETRGDVALSGNFGYELDLTSFTSDDKEIAKRQIEYYKSVRTLIHNGNLYRLISPFEENEASWMFVSPDKKEAIVFYFKTLSEANKYPKKLKLKGLHSNYKYKIVSSNTFYYGNQLMNVGISISEENSDFISQKLRLIMVE